MSDWNETGAGDDRRGGLFEQPIVQSQATPQQTGTFFCSGCKRQFRHTHEGHQVCLTHGCPFETKR